MRDPLTPRIVRYFSAEGSPVDLAVFRVVLFGWIAGAAAFSYDFAWLASAPEGLRVAPLFTAWFWENVPVNPTSARTAQFVVVLASILACIGLAYRFAAVTATVCSLYLFGIPELFGKIYHHHHLIWFEIGRAHV